MTELYNPETERDGPESLSQALETKFKQAYELMAAGVRGYVVEPKGAKAHFIRLHRDESDYDLLVGKPLPESDMPPNVDYSIITIRFRNYMGHGNEDMLVLQDRPDMIFEDIGNWQSGSPLSPEKTEEVFDYVRTAELEQRQL